jgi:environmental stress-induced protein Ves
MSLGYPDSAFAKLAAIIMNARIINKAMFRKMPWANGMGTTTELFAHRNERSDRILWRISMATVSSDGPFSHFAGYDRILVLIEGAGLRLDHQDGTEHCLTSAYQLAIFSGDVATHATLIDGPVQDFNVIADRSAFKPAVTIVSGGNNRVSIDTDVLAVYAVNDGLLINDPDMHSYPVQKGDLLLADAARRGNWSFSGATAIVTQLSKI